MRKARWAGHGDDWPNGHRPCVECGEMKPFSAYHKHKACLFGINTVCKRCRKPKSKGHYDGTSVEYRLWSAAKARARRTGREFSIRLDDVVVPERCPVLGFKMKYGTKTAPSIDRRDPEKGYTPSNISVISKRANMLRNNATFDEMEKILRYIYTCEVC